MKILMRLVSVFPPRMVIRYAAVGGTSALIELFLFYAFVTWLDMPLMAANLAAVCLVTIGGFLGQKYFTFRARRWRTPQLVLYAFQLASNFVLNNGLVFLFGEILRLPPLAAKILQLGLCFIFNFSFSRFVVFGPQIAAIADSPNDAA